MIPFLRYWIAFSLFLPLLISSAFAMTWEELHDQTTESFQKILETEVSPLNLGTRILGADASSPFRLASQPDAELILGSAVNASLYRALSESSRFMLDLTALKSTSHSPEALLHQLKNLKKQSPWSSLLSRTLQDLLNHRIEAELNPDFVRLDEVSLKNWIFGAEWTLNYHLLNATHQGYPITKPLLIINVAKEYAPTGAVSVTDLPIHLMGSQEDFTFFLKFPTSATRTLFARWVDSIHFNISDDLPQLSEAIRTAHAQGFTVFIHCKLGVSRSAALTLDFLMNSSAISPASDPTDKTPLFDRTYHALQELRPEVNINPGFIDTLKHRASSF